MQPTDRAEFDTHITLLCAGFNVPATAERLEAYWRGLAKMPLSALARCVEHALGEHGPDRIPTAPGLWGIYRATKTERPDARKGQAKAADPAFDSIHSFGQRMLLAFVMNPRRAAPSAASLQRMVDAKNQIIASYRQIETEEPVESQEITDALHKRFEAEYEQRPASEYDAARARFVRTGIACERLA